MTRARDRRRDSLAMIMRRWRECTLWVEISQRCRFPAITESRLLAYTRPPGSFPKSATSVSSSNRTPLHSAIQSRQRVRTAESDANEQAMSTYSLTDVTTGTGVDSIGPPPAILRYRARVMRLHADTARQRDDRRADGERFVARVAAAKVQGIEHHVGQRQQLQKVVVWRGGASEFGRTTRASRARSAPATAASSSWCDLR